MNPEDMSCWGDIVLRMNVYFKVKKGTSCRLLQTPFSALSNRPIEIKHHVRTTHHGDQRLYYPHTNGQPSDIEEEIRGGV